MTDGNAIAPYFELWFLPYVSLQVPTPISFGRASIWSFTRQSELIGDPAVRARVGELLAMYREHAGDPARNHPIRDVGVFSVGAHDLHPLTPSERDSVEMLRDLLFLCCLAEHLSMRGDNAGHYISTSENFDIITQGFTLETDRISELAGTIVQRNLMGYRIGSYQVTAPSHVPRPIQFTYDANLLRRLRQTQRADPRLFRRILRAVRVFYKSYYNSPSLAIDARVLLQVSAFEILLDLPESNPREAFKGSVEQLLGQPRERRYRYKYETRHGRRTESRTRIGIWADRFYTLRNHLIHGNGVPKGEYEFGRAQHHLVIAPMVFALSIKALIDESRRVRKQQPVFSQRLLWTGRAVQGDDTKRGFHLEPDLGAFLPLTRRLSAALGSRETVR